MTLRIGMILDNDFPPDSRVESEAVSLVQAGFEVALFSISYKRRPEKEKYRGIDIVRYAGNGMVYQLSALAYSLPFYHLWAARKIKDFIRTQDIDVLHVHDLQVARAAFNVVGEMRLRVPIVLDLHENRPEIMRFYRHVNTLKGRMLINPDRWADFQSRYVKESDHLIVVTEKAKKQLVEQGDAGEDKITVVPNTIHEEIFLKYPIEDAIQARFNGKFNILYLGDTGLRRGTDTAVRAIKILVEGGIDCQLILVGKNKEDRILKDLVARFGVEDRVFFEGWRDVSLFPSYILASDVCISPLKRNLHHDTTYPNKIFQYMAMGKALVVSNCPAQEEVVIAENAGLIHLADDTADLASKISLLYHDEDLRTEMGRNARLAVKEKWNWGKTSSGLINLYSKIGVDSRT